MARPEKDRKVLDDLPTLVAESRRERQETFRSARDGPSISQVCFKCGSSDHWALDCPKMDDCSSNPKKRNLRAYPPCMVRGLAVLLTISVVKSV